jgi:diguanylate cyclase (GGDEF)-like protein
VGEPARPTAAAVNQHGWSVFGPPPQRRPEPSPDHALSAVLSATRALLWIQTPADVAAVARDLVSVLGGRVVPARLAAGDAVPVDLSFGAGEPVVPAVPGTGNARVLLERHLPAFVRDAQRVLELLDHPSRLVHEATIDALTGLANRRTLGRVFGRLQPRDTVIMIDLDHYKAVNDSVGHSEGDNVLRLFGRALAAIKRAAEHVGRYGGEEFVVILGDEGAERFLDRLQAEWIKTRPYPITFSAGVASAHPDPGKALDAADRAMYRAKQAGRNRWERAVAEDYQ